MHTRRHVGSITNLLVLFVVASVGSAYAAKETAKLRVTVFPVETEVFIDGLHMGDATWDGTLTVPGISPGEHTVGLYNYGFTPQTFKLNFEGGKTTTLNVRLEPVGGPVSGPWGRIYVKGARRAAILLNGKTPDYVVGHGGEADGRMNSDLVVPPGTYQMTLVHGDKTIWSGPVTVEAGKMTEVDARRGATETKNWKGKEPGNDVMRFHSGVLRTTVAVGPTTANLTANPTQVNCGESSQLNWNATGAVHAELSGVGAVAPSGQQQVSPTSTTTYTLTASGPGGVATPTATVTVNNGLEATLTVTPPEVTYERVGTRVRQQGTSTVTWSATGAGPITTTVEPFGSVEASGSRQVQPVPEQTGPGPVNQTITYTLHATNPCGGDVTRTATLHLTGTVKAPGAEETTEEISEAALVSLYFPTDWPTKEHAEGGLLKSQQEALNALATAFKTYLEHDPNARLLLEAHADIRSSDQHNKELTERRAARVKDYLVGQGLSASAIDTTAVGKENQLGKDEVKQLESQNPHTPPEARLKGKAADVDWMAYNRRADVILQPLGQHSAKYYPHQAADSSVLWQKAKPTWKVVQNNQ